MDNYVLSCCSTADLTNEHFKARRIEVVPFHFELDGKWYLDDGGITIPYEQFYQKMADGAMTRTSQVNVEEYVTFFQQFLNKGQDVLHLCLSSGISGTYNSAKLAASELKKAYPERTIAVVDSLAASSGYGLFMDKLADLRDEGMGLKDLYTWALEHRRNLVHWFFSTDLTFYVRGGRISKAAGAVGNMMNICPLMNVDYKGELIVRQKIRGKKKVVVEIVRKMCQQAENLRDYSEKCYISQSACMEEARAVADLVEADFLNMNGKVEINNIGTTIGSHTGPGTVALFFWGKERID